MTGSSFMEESVGEADHVRIIDASPEEQASVMQLASLLEIGIELAHKALRQSQWNFECAVDTACKLATFSSAASAGPSQLDVGPCGRASTSGSNTPSVPQESDHARHQRPGSSFCVEVDAAGQLASIPTVAMAGQAEVGVRSSSARSSTHPSGIRFNEQSIPTLPSPVGCR